MVTMGSGTLGSGDFVMTEAGARNRIFFRAKCGGDERYLVCAAGAAAGVSVANAFLLCVLPRVAVPAHVVLCVRGICGCGSHWNGCMIFVTWCCHVR